MHADLIARRKAVFIVYQRYLQADRAWVEARSSVKAYFPSSDQPNKWVIGNAGSRVRKLYEQRARAIAQLQVAMTKLKTARKRLANQHVDD